MLLKEVTLLFYAMPDAQIKEKLGSNQNHDSPSRFFNKPISVKENDILRHVVFQRKKDDNCVVSSIEDSIFMDTMG